MANDAGCPQGLSQNKHKIKTGVRKILNMVKIFGNVNKLNNKLEMLKGFYFYIYNDSLMSKYEQIDLVYNNRLIAIKK